MVIVRVNANLHPVDLAKLTASLREQASTGALVLPAFCELLAEVPDGTEVEVVAGRDTSSDCDTCAVTSCKARAKLRRVNCPLWRAKV